MANEQELNEPEELIGDSNYNPLNEPINEKPYSKPNVQIDPAELQGDIPEPAFTPPPMSMEEPEKNSEKPKDQKEQAPPKKETPANPYAGQPKFKPEPMNQQFKEVPKKEVKSGAKYAAHMVMDGYKMLHQLGNHLVKIPEKKVRKLVQEGELDLSMQIPFDMSGETISAGEMIESYNEQNGELFTVDPEFEEEAMPLLIEVLEKRGIGLTVEQRLGFIVAKDLGIKAVRFAAAKAIQKDMINSMREYTKAVRETNAPPPPPQQQQQQAQPKPQPKQPQEAKEEIVDDFLEDENFTDLTQEELEPVRPVTQAPSVNEEVAVISGSEIPQKRGKGRPSKKS